VLPHPFDTAERIRSLKPFDPRDTLDFVLETIALLRTRIDVPVLGFVGAPFTLMTYMVESPRSKERQGTKAFMWREPELWHELMGYWAEHLLEFGKAQVEAGAGAIQLFDSWAGVLGPDDYRDSVLPHSRRILSGLEEAGIPTINFATGNPALLPLMAEAGGTAMGLDWRISIGEGWGIVGEDRAVQGNLDPVSLLAGSEVAVARADRILEEVGGRPGHIFNVGHGILPETDPAVIRAVVDHVHSVDPAELRARASN
jgi:uroporphyrinogen decarboxylase